MKTTNGVWTSEEVALVLIDYQEEMFTNIHSETSAAEIELNVKFLIKIAKAFNIPIVLSSVGVGMGINQPTRSSISEELPGQKIIDRSSMDAWEDDEFRSEIEKTGRKKLIFCALYTEICLAYPVVDAMRDGYQTMFVVDAVGGLSQLAHRTAIERLTSAGSIPNTSMALVCELFRDWKSPISEKAKEIFSWYMPEIKKLSAK